MGWNGSGQGAASTEIVLKSASGGSRKRLFRWGVMAGAFAFSLCGAGLYCYFRSNVRPSSGSVGEQRHGSRIAEVKPHLRMSNHEQEVPAAHENDAKPKERPPQRPGEVRDGYIMFADGSKARCDGVITSSVEEVDLAIRTFKCNSDQLIASLLTMAPGDGILGSSEILYKDFDEKFEESLKTDIVDEPDDTEEQRSLKKEVIAIRAELKERKDKGENLAALLIETRDQFKELALYRCELEDQVSKLRRDNDFSEKDEEDLLKAANLMLEERGAKPFELPSAAKYYIENQFTPVQTTVE